MYIKFSAKILAAVAVARSYEETRFYLNGVCFEEKTAVATNGHILTAGHDETAHNDAPHGTIMPVSKKAITAMKKARADCVVFDGSTLTVYGETENILYMEPSKPIDGTFPDWRHAVPAVGSETSQEAFSAIVLGQIIETAKTFSKNCAIRVFGDHGGAQTVRYSETEDVFSLAMPTRHEIPAALPDWY